MRLTDFLSFRYFEQTDLADQDWRTGSRSDKHTDVNINVAEHLQQSEPKTLNQEEDFCKSKFY